MTGEHEGRENLTEETKDLERARQSLIEELEDWYQERNQELKKILEHNGDEEKEHVAMLVEWIRRIIQFKIKCSRNTTRRKRSESHHWNKNHRGYNQRWT